MRQFVEPPSDSHNLRLSRDHLLDKQAAVRARRIFVVKQTSHLPATNAAAIVGARAELRLALLFNDK